MKRNLYIGLAVIFLYSTSLDALDRFGRNSLFVAAQNNNSNSLVGYLKNHDSLVAIPGDDGKMVPRYDAAGLHLLHIFALHARTPDILRLGLEIFFACNLDIDELERSFGAASSDGATALHCAYRRNNCSAQLRLALITELLDYGSSPFISSENDLGKVQNAYELTLELEGISKCMPWLERNKSKINQIFSKNIRYVLLHRLFSSYDLSKLSKEKIQSIIKSIFDKDDACALVVLLFWLKNVDIPNNLAVAPRCSMLRENKNFLESAFNLYRQAVVLPEVVATMRRKMPGVKTNNVSALLLACRTGRYF